MCRALNITHGGKLFVPCQITSVVLLRHNYTDLNIKDLLAFGQKVKFHATKNIVEVRD